MYHGLGKLMPENLINTQELIAKKFPKPSNLMSKLGSSSKIPKKPL